MKSAFVVLGFLLLVFVQAAYAAPKKAKPKAVESIPVETCMPVAPLFGQLKASGLEYESITDKAAVRKFAEILRRSTEGATFPEPTQIVVAFKGENAAIGIIVNDHLCAVLRGPADSLRRILRVIQGQSVSDM